MKFHPVLLRKLHRNPFSLRGTNCELNFFQQFCVLRGCQTLRSKVIYTVEES